MITALWNGVSGLNTFERALNNESNNMTNVNTVGHKADDIRFEDMMYTNGLGRGTAVETITKRMYQGDLKITGNTYDVAINGKGYFLVKSDTSDQVYYTRAGNFKMGSDGSLQTANDFKVLGLTPQSSSVVSSDPAITQITNVHDKFINAKTINNGNFIQTINSRTSNYDLSATDVGESGNGFKTKSSVLSDIEALTADYNEKLDLYAASSTALPIESTKQITTLNYSNSLNQLQNENDFIKVNINNIEVLQQFDTDIETTLKKFSDKISKLQGISSSVDTNTGMVTVNSLIPGKDISINSSAINEDFAIIADVQNASLGAGIGLLNSSRNALRDAIELGNGKFIELTNTISLTNQNDLNVGEIQLKLSNLALSENVFGTIEIDDGMIFLNDNNNKFIVGKIQTAFFTNEQGLEAQGDNIYANTTESGRAMYAGKLNDVTSNTLEQSTSNVSDSLTSLLIFQKAFEANSKSITTSDELLKIAIELRK